MMKLNNSFSLLTSHFHTAIDSSNIACKTKRSRAFWLEILTLKGLWIRLGEILLRGSEPKIIQKCDRQGNLYFNVYDPIDNQSHIFDSEREVRTWLEQRYYR